MYHQYNVLHPFGTIFLFPAIASIIHASHFHLQLSHSLPPPIHTTLASILPTKDDIIERVGSSIIKFPKHNDVRIKGQCIFCLPNPLLSVSCSGRAISIPFKRLPSSPHTPTTYTTITLIPTVLSLCIHHPPSLPSHLQFTHSLQAPHATRSTDSSHHLVTPHSFLLYFFNLYYFSNSSSRRLSWRVAWWLPIFWDPLPTVQTSSFSTFHFILQVHLRIV